MDVSLFDFDLPDSAIALRPAVPRDSAKLLLVGRDGLQDKSVTDLPAQFRKGDVLVLNDTRVLPAALTATRPAREHGGGTDVRVTINLHKRAAAQKWRAFVKPAKRLKNKDQLIFEGDLRATVFDKQDGGDVGLCFNRSGAELDAAIESIGVPPLPPYIARQREVDARDIADYQTVYAKDNGSVAAPTAGLHFTPGLLEQLKASGVEIVRLTLHVGAGTFLPMKSDTTEGHVMHSEWREISENAAESINAAKSQGRRIIAVGTTALRALESAAKDGTLTAQTGETDIFITPGYEFQIVDGLMTNFHLPRSTLFMLVSALAGLETMQGAYKHAIELGYRFYSYGDSSLIWRKGA